MKKQVRILKPTNITFTSYNGVPWIYGEGASWRNFKENQFLAVEWFDTSQVSLISIDKINFRDTALARIKKRKGMIETTVQVKVKNCQFQMFNTKREKGTKYVRWFLQSLVIMNTLFMDITFENCTIKANYQTGVVTYTYGFRCLNVSTTTVKFINTTIDNARYSLYAWSKRCRNTTAMSTFTLNITNCIVKSSQKRRSRKAQFTIDIMTPHKSRKWVHINIERSRFEDLSAKFRTAAVLEIRDPSLVRITQCTFKRNIGNKGGALSFRLCSLYINDSYFEGNEAEVRTICSYRDEGGSGGAIFVSGIGSQMKLWINNSTFINNMARCYGSAVYLSSFTDITVRRSQLKTLFARRNSTGTMWLSSSRSLTMDNVSFEAREGTLMDGELFFARSKIFRTGAKEPYFKCPEGSAPNISNIYSVKSEWSSRKVSCHYCPKHTYTLLPSYVSGLQETKRTHTQRQRQCHKCRFGAVCDRGIRPKPNFWGYGYEGKAFMLVCPPGYCCQTKDQCVALQSCNGMRTGRLCGKCKNGYFQSAFTSECLQDDVCKTGKFWAVAICLCVLFTVMVIFLQDIFLIIVKLLRLEKVLSVSKRLIELVVDAFSRMKKVNQRRDDNTGTAIHSMANESLDTAEEHTDESSDDQCSESRTSSGTKSMACGLIKITFFFYQIHSILTIYKSNREIRYLSNVKRAIRSVFNLDVKLPLGREFHCPHYRMDSTTKALMKALFLINCVLFATFLYICVHALTLCFKSSETIQRYSMKAKPKLLTAILQLILLGYSILISSTLSLVTCLPLVTGQKILYIDGSVSCYQHWQYAILTFIIVWAIPLIYALHKLPIYMRNGEISIRGFYIALLLPLPFAVYAMIRGARKIKCSNASDIQTHSLTTPFISPATKQYTDDMTLKLLNVIEGPFRCKSSGKERIKLSWEPVLLLQRLLLSLCHTFVLEPTNRSLVLPIFVIVFAMLNCLYRPFNSIILNATNGVIFILLCITGIINVIYTFIYEYGNEPNGPIIQLFVIFDYVEATIVLIFPLLAVLTFVVLAVAKLTVFISSTVFRIVSKCKRLLSNDC